MKKTLIVLTFACSSLLLTGCQSKKDGMLILCQSPIVKVETGQKEEHYIEQNLKNAEVKAFWENLQTLPPAEIAPAFKKELDAVGLSECTAYDMMTAKPPAN